MALPLMGHQGALDWQNNGYKSTATAVAELVDNSIQAGASKVDIYLIEKQSKSGRHHISDIYISDDGCGMNPEIFQIAFQFGGGSRYGAKKGLGRYGMGLPNASVSQTKRFEAYTWQDHESLYFNYVDLEEVVATKNPFLNEIQQAYNLDSDLSKLIDYRKKKSGTIVKWVDINHVRPKTIGGLVGHLKLKLGKMFRYYIIGDEVEKVEINILAYRSNGNDIIEKKNESVYGLKPYDPLFLMRNTQVSDICGNTNYEKPTSIEYAKADKPFEFKEYDDEGNLKDIHHVTIRYSYIQPELRKSLGRNAGDTSLGKEYLKKGSDSPYQNISIVRAKREIDVGSFGFITNISDHTNRFWSIEIQIDSISDEVFGIDNRKQSATKFRLIDSKEEPILDDEPFDLEVLRVLSETITANIPELKKKIAEGKTVITVDSVPDNPTPDNPIYEVTNGEDDDYVEEPIDKIRSEAEQWFLTRFPKYHEDPIKLTKIIDWFINLKTGHYLVYSDLGDGVLYNFKTYNDKTIIEVNTRHLFYERFLEKLEDSNDDIGKRIIRYLFSALVNAEKKSTNPQEKTALMTFRINMALALGSLIINNEEIVSH